MSKKQILVCFIGIDGSGKSTISRNLVKKITFENYKSVYIYGRVKPLISRVVMSLGRKIVVRRKKNDIFDDYLNYTQQKKKALNNFPYSNLFVWSLLFDQIFQINFMIFFYRLFGNEVIICDRYVHDTIVTDIATNLNYSTSETIKLLNWSLKFTPTPNIVFLVDISEDIAFRRKNDVPDIEYLMERRRLYNACNEFLKLNLLDGSKSQNDICVDAFTAIRPYLEN